MLVDVHFRFDGNWGSVGKCHLRFCQFSEDKPLVIVCSQYKNYLGTSITNAVHRIAEAAFYRVASRKIEGLRFDFELPVFQEWHDDVNLFDRALAALFQRKYGRRFTTQKLNIKEIFDRIVWIEHYPKGWASGMDESRYQIVKLDDSGSPIWSGRRSDNWFCETTGYTTEELLISDGSLDLNKVEGRPRKMYESAEILQKRPGYQVIRWTEDVVAGLSSMLSSDLTYKGRPDSDDVKEGTVHDGIEKILAIKLPARGLFQTDFDFSKLLGISVVTKQKSADFAIFRPDGKTVDAILEVKRTSANANALKKEICKDIARLLMLSRRLKCACYLLVYGNTKLIRSQLDNCDGYLAFDDHDSYRDRHFSVADIKVAAEYQKLLRAFDIKEGSSRLQGIKSNGPNSVVLWQVSDEMSRLEVNRPYRCNIEGV